MRNALLVPLLALFHAVPATAQRPAASPSPPHVVALGEGEAKITPDVAHADISVVTNAETAATAAAENARLMSTVRAALQRAGVPREAISGAGYSVDTNFRYEQGTQIQDGYRATNTLRVETRQFDRLGEITDAALAAGANRIQQVRFTSSDTEGARQKAITAAVERARADAEAMARAAGGRLGALLELSTSRFDALPGVFQGVAARGVRDDFTTITPRELAVRATVVARWEFVPR